MEKNGRNGEETKERTVKHVLRTQICAGIYITIKRIYNSGIYSRQNESEICHTAYFIQVLYIMLILSSMGVLHQFIKAM